MSLKEISSNVITALIVTSICSAAAAVLKVYSVESKIENLTPKVDHAVLKEKVDNQEKLLQEIRDDVKFIRRGINPR